MVTSLWLDDRPPASADVCIVGTGPAGATLARELSTSGQKVVVLESGDTRRRSEVDELNAVENVGRARAEDQWSVRNRILGGSSHTWGGRCAPFDDIDYAVRPWVDASGWPFGPDEIEPYLHRAADHLGLSPGNGFNDDRFWTLAGRPRPASSPDPAVVRSFFWQFSRDPQESYPFEYRRFGRDLVDLVGPDVDIVLGATVLGIDTTDTGATSGVVISDPEGQRHRIRARTVVLCAGGIENARLLLLAARSGSPGLRDPHGLVGRFLMDHPRGPVGWFDVDDAEALRRRLLRFNVRGRLYRAGFRLSPDVQERERLLNAAAWLGEELAEDDPWDAARRVASGKIRSADLKLLAQNAPMLVKGAKEYLLEGDGFPRRYRRLELLAMCEQRPDPDSRVTLSERTDRFGQPLSRVNWRAHEDEARTLRHLAFALRDQLPRMGLPAPRLAEWVIDGAGLPESFIDVAHPTGTTRMSRDPESGVVDADGQVHGTVGLFVVGSSTFPTAGHCNPTQMIVAMAVRLADHLKQVASRERIVTSKARADIPRDTGTVLLTGATGRIGRVVSEDLLARGYRVRATTSRTPVPQDGRLDWRVVDFAETLSADTYDDLVRGCDAVIHLAAVLGDRDVMPKVNTETTRELARSAERAGARSFCYVSTVSVYGSGRRRTMREDSQVLTVDRDVREEYLAMDYVRAYGRTKLAGEHAVNEVAGSVDYTILRPTVVVDVVDLVDIRHWPRSKRYLAAHRHAHHVYVRDVADAIAWSVERGLGEGRSPGRVEVFNVSEDDYEHPRHGDFLRRAQAVTGDARFAVVRVPGVADWLHDVIRFRLPTLRNPLWRMIFPADKLREAGFTSRWGMAHAQALALARLADDVDRCEERHL